MTCEESEEVKHAKLLEIQAVKVAESGNLGDALELLTKTISEVPNYASVYNNRAQVCGHGQLGTIPVHRKFEAPSHD